MKKAQEYITFLTPEFIYVPFDDEKLLSIDRTRKVYHNGYLGTKANGDKIFSPVSGTILGTKNSNYFNYSSNSLVIENDFIDKRITRQTRFYTTYTTKAKS